MEKTEQFSSRKPVSQYVRPQHSLAHICPDSALEDATKYTFDIKAMKERHTAVRYEKGVIILIFVRCMLERRLELRCKAALTVKLALILTF
jgi:hypothetical protein